MDGMSGDNHKRRAQEAYNSLSFRTAIGRSGPRGDLKCRGKDTERWDAGWTTAIRRVEHAMRNRQ